MTDRLQKLMLGHGFLVVMVAMFAGFMLFFLLVGGLEVWPGTIIPLSIYGTEAGWVRAHSGGTANGLLVIAVGLSLPHLNLSAAMQKLTAWGLIYVAWSFTAFYWIGNASPNRALSFGDNPMGEATTLSIIGFLPGLPSVFLVVIILFIGAKAVLFSKDS
ncbi:MAG: isomerase [Pseudomonadota bacterium]